MEFEWDEAKNSANIAKHGFGFERAKAIFNNLRLKRQDHRRHYGEIREISIGLMEETTIVTVVHTDRQGKVRIISARKASPKEKKAYTLFQRAFAARTRGNA